MASGTFSTFVNCLPLAARIHFTTLDVFLKETIETEVPIEVQDTGLSITRTENAQIPSENVKKQPELKNNLASEIGAGAMNLLWDLFVHVEGPRVRCVSSRRDLLC